MGRVGSLGEVAFEVSSGWILTWNDCVRDVKANYATHEVIDGKEKLQFVGLSLEEFSLAITLDARWCVPKTIIKLLNIMMESGDAYVLMLGGHTFGRFVIESITENRKRTDEKGRLMLVYIQLKLKEYV